MNNEILTIITSYNDSDYLVTALQSCLDQEIKNDVLVIIDGYMDDGLQSIISAYQSCNVRFHILKKNIGKSACCNIALSMYSPSYEYVCFLDADDRWMPKKLTRQVEMMESQNIVACGTSYEVCDERGIRRGSVSMPRTREEVIGRSLFGPAMLWSSIMIKGTVARSLLIREEFRAAMDYDFCLRIIKSNELCNVSDPLTSYTARPGSITNSGRRQQQLRNHAYSLAYAIVGEYDVQGQCFEETLGAVSRMISSLSGVDTLLSLHKSETSLSEETLIKIGSCELGRALLCLMKQGNESHTVSKQVQ